MFVAFMLLTIKPGANRLEGLNACNIPRNFEYIARDGFNLIPNKGAEFGALNSLADGLFIFLFLAHFLGIKKERTPEIIFL